jgi:hypothetical protein
MTMRDRHGLLREDPRLSQDEPAFVAVCLFAPGRRPIVHLCHSHCVKLNTLHNLADLLSYVCFSFLSPAHGMSPHLPMGCHLTCPWDVTVPLSLAVIMCEQAESAEATPMTRLLSLSCESLPIFLIEGMPLATILHVHSSELLERGDHLKG